MSDAPPSRIGELVIAASRQDKSAAEELLPALYSELRKLAASMMAKVPPGDTLQPTALVHEAYLRLIGDCDPGWDGRNHFFGSAASAMRQILIERARHKGSIKAGGAYKRIGLDDVEIAIASPAHDVLALDESLQSLELVDPRAAKIAELRYFTGLTVAETASVLGLSVRTTTREWTWARAYLAKAIKDAMNGGQR